MERIDIAIVGGGPVGLTLGCLLAKRGLDVRVLEARVAPSEHSRAIGIHPPSLKVLDAFGAGDAVRERAVAIRGGQVFLDARFQGRLALEDSPLSLPQSETESILASWLDHLAPGALRRTAAVSHIGHGADSIEVAGAGFDSIRASLLIGCDGANGVVRTLAGIGRRGGPHPDRYLMGDFDDDTAFGPDAALFFGVDGIVESFPLPDGRRRWVARLSERRPSDDLETLNQVVQARTSYPLPVETCSWISGFGVQTYLAERFLQGRIALLGDTAHTVSPIGGQGMNLGILGAAALASVWNGDPKSLIEPLAAHRRLARTVARRAEFNTSMGRPARYLSPTRLLIRSVLASSALSRRFARSFAMCDLAPS